MKYYLVNVDGDLMVYVDVFKAREAAHIAGVRLQAINDFDVLCDAETKKPL